MVKFPQIYARKIFMLKSKDKAKLNTKYYYIIYLRYLLFFGIVNSFSLDFRQFYIHYCLANSVFFQWYFCIYVDIFIVRNADALYQLCRRGILFQRECCLYYLYIIFIATFIFYIRAAPAAASLLARVKTLDKLWKLISCCFQQIVATVSS